MRYLVQYLCLCIVLLLPPATSAKFTGEVIFLYPGDVYNELWITHIENAKNTRLLYEHNEDEEIYDFALQKDGPLLVISAGPLTSDIFLIDRNRLWKGARDLTKGKFDATAYVDISPNGDVLFCNFLIEFHEVPPIEGLYLIPNDEIKKANPQATLLKEGLIKFIRWGPDGKQFLYRTSMGLFLYNLHTGADLLITKDRVYPAFSPDGKKLAFIFQPTLEPGVELDVISLEVLYPQLFQNVPENHVFFNLEWPRGKYLVYGIHHKQRKKTRHFVVHLDGFPPEQILADMEDTFEDGLPTFDFGNTTFAVEPTNRLTTLWGKLKAHNLSKP